jgi:hypothetical protein
MWNVSANISPPVIGHDVWSHPVDEPLELLSSMLLAAHTKPVPLMSVVDVPSGQGGSPGLGANIEPNGYQQHSESAEFTAT